MNAIASDSSVSAPSASAADAIWQERFAGIDRLYGQGAVARFRQCRVAVVGMGGVGSWAVEALVRTGIGHLRLIDADDVCVANTNRRLPALGGQYARAQVEAVAGRRRAGDAGGGRRSGGSGWGGGGCGSRGGGGQEGGAG